MRNDPSAPPFDLSFFHHRIMATSSFCGSIWARHFLNFLPHNTLLFTGTGTLCGVCPPYPSDPRYLMRPLRRRWLSLLCHCICRSWVVGAKKTNKRHRLRWSSMADWTLALSWTDWRTSERTDGRKLLRNGKSGFAMAFRDFFISFSVSVQLTGNFATQWRCNKFIM